MKSAKIIQQISSKLKNKGASLALLSTITFIASTTYAQPVEFLSNSDYEVRVHFIGDKSANAKTPFAKIIDNNTHAVSKANATFDAATDTLIIKEPLIRIKNVGSGGLETVDGTVSSSNDTVLIYGAKFNDYGLIVPIKINADTHNFSSQYTPNRIDSVLFNGSYKYSISYTEYFDMKFFFPISKFGTHFKTFSCTEKENKLTCVNSIEPLVIDVTLPYNSTQFYSPKKASVKVEEKTVSY